jgi:hypothetical protein
MVKPNPNPTLDYRITTDPLRGKHTKALYYYNDLEFQRTWDRGRANGWVVTRDNIEGIGHDDGYRNLVGLVARLGQYNAFTPLALSVPVKCKDVSS